MGAVFKFPHCRLKLELSPTTFLLSLFKPRPIPHPIPFVRGTIRSEQAAPIDLKISIRKKKRTTKTNRGWGKGEERRETTFACSDGRAIMVPTVLWLADLEVPDPQWMESRETRCHILW